MGGASERGTEMVGSFEDCALKQPSKKEIKTPSKEPLTSCPDVLIHQNMDSDWWKKARPILHCIS